MLMRMRNCHETANNNDIISIFLKIQKDVKDKYVKGKTNNKKCGGNNSR